MCKIAHMVDRQKLRAEQQDLIRATSRASSLKPSALAKAIGVRPSTLNKVLDEKHTHLLSASTVALLEAFLADSTRARLTNVLEFTATPYSASSAASEGSLDIDSEVIRDLLNSPENKKLLGLWIGMDNPTKLATLDILEAVTRIASRKVG